MEIMLSLPVSLCWRTDMDFTIKKRDPFSHKGDYGRVCVIGGSKGMCGSVYLASMAALRTGSGLVYTIVPESISDILQIKSVENIILPLKCENDKLSEESLSQIFDYLHNKDSVAIGCGMGKDNLNFEIIRQITQNFKGHILIDADGLNSIKDFSKLEFEDYNVAITPHPLEFSRLSGLDVEYINNNRQKVAREFSLKHKCVVVLKGHETIVSKADEIYVNKTGNPGMATAGSGDCLSGIIAGLFYGRTVFEACKLGVYIHGLAGDFAKQDLGEDSIIASDIIKYLPNAINACKEK